MEIAQINQFHPSRPLPLSEPDIKLKALTPDVTKKMNTEVTNGLATPYVYMGLSWEDYLTLGKYFKEVESKFAEYNALLCYYRKDLKEPRCN